MGENTDKIEYSRLRVDDLEDLIKLIKLYENVFKMKPFQYPSKDYLKKILKNENTILWLPNMKKKS